LLSAFAFDVGGGSEAGLGWQIASRLSRVHDVTVLFGNLHAKRRSDEELDKIKRACEQVGHLTPFFVDGDEHAKWLAAQSDLPGLWWLYYRAYRRWQHLAYREAEHQHRLNPFDVAHHLTFISYREPGDLWRLGIPFFWGPISGSPMVPLSFLKTFRGEQLYRWGSRNVANWLQMRLSSRCRKAARASAKIWAVSGEDRRMVEQHWNCPAENLLETGCEVQHDRHPRSKLRDEPLRIIWSGRFDPIKALPVLLRALSGIPKDSWQLDILGDGSEGPRWKELAQSLMLTTNVTWHGMVSRDLALRTMESGHVFVHSSVKEGTPHVVLEALSMGMPIICHDACGMGVAVTSYCGIKFPLSDPASSYQAIFQAISRFLSEPALLEKLSRGAIERAAELNWDHKVLAFNAAYSAAVASH
jgi:glycosyltransferase involved in cell wall biosynthesis